MLSLLRLGLFLFAVAALRLLFVCSGSIFSNNSDSNRMDGGFANVWWLVAHGAVLLLALILLHLNSSLQTIAKEEEERAQAAKQRRLKLAELLGSDRKHDKTDPNAEKGKKSKKEKKKKSGFIKKMRVKILNNLQIFIDKIRS